MEASVPTPTPKVALPPPHPPVLPATLPLSLCRRRRCRRLHRGPIASLPHTTAYLSLTLTLPPLTLLSLPFYNSPFPSTTLPSRLSLSTSFTSHLPSFFLFIFLLFPFPKLHSRLFLPFLFLLLSSSLPLFSPY